MKYVKLLSNITFTLFLLVSTSTQAQESLQLSEEQKAGLEAAGFETNPEVLKQLATGGQNVPPKPGLVEEGSGRSLLGGLRVRVLLVLEGPRRIQT